MSVLVLGIGNLLMGDEGVGVHVVRRLLGSPLPDEVTAVDGGTGGFHLLSYFQDYDRLILVDAAADGRTPGTISELSPRFAADYPRSLTAHDIGLRDVVEAAALLGPLPRTELITISVGDKPAMGLALSPQVSAAVPAAVETVRRHLDGVAEVEYGHA